MFGVTTGAILSTKIISSLESNPKQDARIIRKNSTNLEGGDMPRVDSDDFSIGLNRVESILLLNQLGEFCSSGKIAVTALKLISKSVGLMLVGYILVNSTGVKLYKRA